MLSSIFASTKHVEDFSADSPSTADQEKQLLIERERDQDRQDFQDFQQDQHHDKEAGVPQLDETRHRKRRAMALAPRVMVALLVCCFVALGLASTGIIQPCHHDEAANAEQAAIEGQPSRLSVLLGGNDLHQLLERFSSHALGQLGKRQTDNATTTATSVTTAVTTVLSSSTVATVTVSSSSEPASSSSASSAPTTSAAQTTPTTTPTTAATTTVVQTTTKTSQAATTTATSTPTLSETSAASSASTTAVQDTTLTTQTSSTKSSQSANKATTTAVSSSSPSSKLVTATLTSTLPDGGVSVVTMTSYSYVNAAGATGTSTTPNASLQTDGAAAQGKLLSPGLAVAGAGLWLLQYL